MKNRSVWFVFLVLLYFLGLNATQAEVTMEDKVLLANHLYSESAYDSALVVYKSVLDAGFESPTLYYNIGNSFFKLKKIPSAILYYEKARKLMPNNEDLLHNINIANSMIIDKIEVLPHLFFRHWWTSFYNLFAADSWARISLGSFSIALLLIFLYLVSYKVVIRKIGFYAGLLSLLVTIFSFGLASQKYYYEQQVNEAIIFTPTITVKSAPSSSSVDLFVLHEGTKVRVLDHTNDWMKIKISNGSIGWLPSESMVGI